MAGTGLSYTWVAVALLVPSGRFELDIESDRLESGRLAHDASKDGSETVIALGW